jgi:hypothetical protein
MTRTRIRLTYAVATALFACLVADPGNAQSIQAGNSDSVSFDEALDEVPIDVMNSIDDAKELRGLSFEGDFRLGDTFYGDNIDDVTLGDPDTVRARWRIRSTWGLTENFRAVARVAGLCSSSACKPDFVLQPNATTGATMEDGQITIDEFFLQRFRSDRFNVEIGRMQTKFLARGGVFSKSLTQNNSDNLRVNWTDGVHATFKAKNDWESHVVLQYNSEDGPSNVRRDPLDFSDDGSRVSYLFSFENLQERRRLVQRAFDIIYLPSALLVSGQSDGPLEDYLAIAARAAARWPVRAESWRIRLSSEVGYAPNTPTKAAAGVTGSGDADGFAWNITASVMDFVPHHSIGIDYAQAGAGWLVSPQYANNQRQIEIWYMWRPNKRMTLDIHARQREDIQQRITEDPDLDSFDFFFRFTWSFDIKDSQTQIIHPPDTTDPGNGQENSRAETGAPS